MGRRPTKAADNPFCKARLEAAKCNEKLFSKECAAELLGVSASTLSDYELGYTKIVPTDIVIKMADLYNAPELENIYCTEMCPLGYEMPKVSVEGLDHISLSVIYALRKTDEVCDLLVDIARNGVVSEDKKPDMYEILANLKELERITQCLNIWIKKNL